jgi:hypothetical protein
MSISSIGGTTPYTPLTSTAPQPAPQKNDPDHDGDTDSGIGPDKDGGSVSSGVNVLA